MDNQDSQLLGELARRNWIILLVLLGLSLLMRNKDFTLGVASGGLMVICGYQWLYGALVKALAAGGEPGIKSFQISHFMRLGALGAMLLLLIAVVKVNILGLIIGLSVVVINIVFATIKRVIKVGGTT